MQSENGQHFLSLGKEGNCLIKQFNENLVNKLIGVIGPKGKGKTIFIKNLINDLLCKNNNIIFEIIIVSCKEKNSDYDYLEGKKYLTSQISDVCKYALNEKFNNHKIIIFDDCINLDMINDTLIFNNKYYNSTIIISNQVITKPYMINNLNYAFFTKTLTKSSIKSVYDRYVDNFMDYKTFERIFMICTENYNLLAINNFESLNNSNKISFYKSRLQITTNNNYILPDIYELMPELINSGDIKTVKKKLIKQINEIKKIIIQQSNKLDELCLELDNLLGD
ncbi:hypothetical protein H012_gp237 [Acanthamoeba polyphaga moumouvirus]|uniref:Uncharacterized protein n=2 Tax=Moumouvirus TaxID=3080801 RepID=L7RGJ6_9VIRU|nr:hypothetical protein H012_gp237 [Acanthamoeba polyphaga moumouvirus]AEX62449.1 hypothetical protein mv_R244 [Moumouvirus Monve]AGC02215.1 hypothetical protein Moumou_00694 [Acanthamoeba polyphaga moumouvirus]AQN68784.1 hypothetical protein [Saudi moumouvirus]